MGEVTSLRRIAVYCASSLGCDPGFEQAARELARGLVMRNLGLVYGGARNGLMGVVADEVLAQGGQVTGILPHALARWELAHEGLQDLQLVSSMHERKAAMESLADGFVALPGGIGTLEEIFEMLSWAQLGVHHKPCALLNVNGFYDPLIGFLDHAVEQGVIKPASRALLQVFERPDRLLDAFAAYRSPVTHRWLDKGEA